MGVVVIIVTDNCLETTVMFQHLCRVNRQLLLRARTLPLPCFSVSIGSLLLTHEHTHGTGIHEPKQQTVITIKHARDVLEPALFAPFSPVKAQRKLWMGERFDIQKYST